MILMFPNLIYERRVTKLYSTKHSENLGAVRKNLTSVRAVEYKQEINVIAEPLSRLKKFIPPRQM